MAIISPHIGEGLDGTLIKICEQINSPLPIIPISRVENFVFNHELFNISGGYVLIDFIEYGWDWKYWITGTHILGLNDKKFDHLFTGEWRKFFDWVAKNKPTIYFKRELLNDDVTATIIPIEYPSWFKVPDPQSKTHFDSRPISLFNYWGRSNEERLRVHSEIWQMGYKKGYDICDNIYYLSQFLQHERNPNKWVTFNIPWYSRIPMENIFAINGVSKLSLSMPGAGRKCFRSTESPLNSIMVMIDDDFAWSYDWVDGINCLKVDHQREISQIEAALSRSDLYDIYCAGVETAREYEAERYIKNYVEQKINMAYQQSL